MGQLLQLCLVTELLQHSSKPFPLLRVLLQGYPLCVQCPLCAGGGPGRVKKMSHPPVGGATGPTLYVCHDPPTHPHTPSPPAPIHTHTHTRTQPPPPTHTEDEMIEEASSRTHSRPNHSHTTFLLGQAGVCHTTAAMANTHQLLLMLPPCLWWQLANLATATNFCRAEVAACAEGHQ